PLLWSLTVGGYSHLFPVGLVAFLPVLQAKTQGEREKVPKRSINLHLLRTIATYSRLVAIILD
ncbi:MAG: hypothetical protein AB2541_07775, partial [Candidatus Thiodiazotropha sp.]